MPWLTVVASCCVVQAYGSVKAYNMVSTAGFGKHGMVSFVTRGLRPHVVKAIEVAGCRGLWGVRYTGSRPVPGVGDDSEEEEDDEAGDGGGEATNGDASAGDGTGDADMGATGAGEAPGSTNGDAGAGAGGGADADGVGDGDDDGEDEDDEEEEDDDDDVCRYLILSAENSTTVLAMYQGDLGEVKGDVRARGCDAAPVTAPYLTCWRARSYRYHRKSASTLPVAPSQLARCWVDHEWCKCLTVEYGCLTAVRTVGAAVCRRERLTDSAFACSDMTTQEMDKDMDIDIEGLQADDLDIW